MKDDFVIKPEHKVLIVGCNKLQFEALFEKKESKSINNIDLVENVDAISQEPGKHSGYDVIISGFLDPEKSHSNKELESFLKLLKLQGKVIIYEALGKSKTLYQLETGLVLSGFINTCQRPVDTFCFSVNGVEIKGKVGKMPENTVFCVEGNKPNYEVGSSKPISSTKTQDVAAIWKLDETMDEGIIDCDELLEEEDLKKPDPTSLRVCGTTGKRKACKDCSCGLAEELRSSEPLSSSIKKTANSSCGNCYLGDAFRCASCPYLGMPAFKPGEKVQLDSSQLTG